MKQTILRYGLISGAIGAALMFITGWVYQKNGPDFENGEIYGNIGILLSMLFVFLGVKSYRDKEGGGLISFGKAFQVGLLITLISSVGYVLAWMIVYHFMMPDFMDYYIKFALDQMRAQGMPEEVLNAKAAEMESFKEMYQNPLVRFGITMLEPLRIGLPVTLITAIVLRKDRMK